MSCTINNFNCDSFLVFYTVSAFKINQAHLIWDHVLQWINRIEIVLKAIQQLSTLQNDKTISDKMTHPWVDFACTGQIRQQDEVFCAPTVWLSMCCSKNAKNALKML